MIKRSIAILVICLIGVYSFAENSNNKKPVNVDEEIVSLNDSIRKLTMQSYQKEADELTKKADYEASKGHTELAEAYKKCAEAKTQIAEGYKQGKQKLIDEGNETFFLANTNFKKVKREFDKQMGDLKAKYQDIVKKYQNMAEEYDAKAKSAYDAGNKELYLIYYECASARKKIAKGVQSVIHGRCDYIKAVDNYNQFKPSKKMVVSKLVIPKSNSEINKLSNKLLNDAHKFTEEAKEATLQNNAQKAVACNQIADAKAKEAAGFENILSGRNNFIRAEQKLENYNQGQKTDKTGSK